MPPDAYDPAADRSYADVPLTGTSWLAIFGTSKGIVKSMSPRFRSLLTPYPEDDGRLSVSTYRMDELSDDQIRGFADHWLRHHSNLPEGRHVHWVLLVPESVFRNRGLHLNPDNANNRHVNVEGWPEDKAEYEQLALELSEATEDEGRVLRMKGL